MAVTRPNSAAEPGHGAFTVALTADFFDADGRPKYRDMGLEVLDAEPRMRRRVLAEQRPVLGADQLAGCNGMVVLTPKVTADSVSQADQLLAIGRFGVGYDSVDVAACTAADVLLFITSGAVDRSVAEATLTWMLALGHHVLVKDRLVRTGRWHERSNFMGGELRERTLGIVGFGGIARALVELIRGFGMQQPLAFDPFLDAESAARLGVRLVELDELLASADYVSLHCPLTPQTRGLIGARELARMKPSAFLINTARGGIVDEDALFQALAERRIAGAGIDCFADEPVTTPQRFATLDNVLLAPHSIAWTDELFREIGRRVCQGMVQLSLGRRPAGAVNAEVFARPGFRAKWERICGAAAVD